MTTAVVLVTCLFAFLGSAVCQLETTTCSPTRRGQELGFCLSGIGSAAQNDERYWFGSSFYQRCPNGPTRQTSECYVPPGVTIPQSISSLAFTPGTFDPRRLDRYLDVVYTSQPGSYPACGNVYRSDHTIRFTADPLSSRTVDAWITRDAPRITWDSSPNQYYTLIMKDVGYGYLHALYINVRGNDIGRAQAILPYVRPGNPSRFGNVYLFLLFAQNSSMELDPRYANITGPVPFNISDYVQIQDLSGPIAMNWVLVTGDPYAVERARLRGALNNCPHFISEAIREPRRRTFLPDKPEFTVAVNVTYFSEAFAFNSCCSVYQYIAHNATLNPLGHGTVKAGHARDKPRIELYPSIVFFNPATGFGAKRYTLLMVDADFRFPTEGSNDRPLIHWLVVDIPNGKVNEGQEVVRYMEPYPLDLGSHYYYFLLYEQNGDIWDKYSYLNYIGRNCSSIIAGRCLFDVNGYVMSNSLRLVGASWMLVRADEFVSYSRVNRGEPADRVCGHAPKPCRTIIISGQSAIVSTLPILAFCSFAVVFVLKFVS